MTTGEETMSGPGPSSRGAPWAEDDYAEMVALLRAGGSDAQVAAALGRSVGSLEHRAQMMLPVGHAREDVQQLAALRERLAGEASYDWRTPVRAALDAKGYHFWTRAEEAVLAQGWVAAIPMRDLVDHLGLPEPAIIRQLVGWHLAADTDEVAARIGLVPGGDMELRWPVPTPTRCRCGSRCRSASVPERPARQLPHARHLQSRRSSSSICA